MTTPVEGKICSADDAVGLVKDGDTVVSEGFTLFLQAEALSATLEKRFLKTNHPRDLTLVFVAMHGISNKEGGIGHFAHEGLLKRVIGGYWGWFPDIGKLALEEKIEAYNMPQGVIAQLFRDIAAKRPGCITHIGLNTFIDPEFGGGRMNNTTPPDLVERISLDGKSWLWYKAFPVDIGFLSAPACDYFGNLIFDSAPIFGESLSIAQAVHNSGGTVIAQVGKVLDAPAHPHKARVPGILVDKIVVGRTHEQGAVYAANYKPEFSLPVPTCTGTNVKAEKLPLCARRIIAERACNEIKKNDIVNLGIGLPEEIAKIVSERGLTHDITLTVESGPIGGVPASGLAFGASLYPQAVIDADKQFDFYDGGGLDFAALGAAQIDAMGNVNVSKFNSRMAGVGGFINISQTAKKLVFCTTFTCSGLEMEIAGGNLHITHEGKIPKLIDRVEQISFNAKQALLNHQEVFYITERAMFKLTLKGIELMEVAPGIDVDRHILSNLNFTPVINNVSIMKLNVFDSA